MSIQSASNPLTAIESEMGLLGAAIEDAPRILSLCERSGITAEAFYTEQHRQIFVAITGLHKSGAPVSLQTTLLPYLQENDRLKECGGIEYIEKCFDAGFVAEAEHHISKIRDAANRRRLLKLYHRACERITQADTEPGMLADELRQALGDLRNNQGGASTSRCQCDDAAVVLQSEPPEPVATLTDICGPGDILQLNGSSKTRKSFALLQLAFCADTGMPFLGIPCKPGPVVYLNLEIRPEHFRCRVWRMAKALGIGPSLPNTLTILHARGRTPEAAIADVLATCQRTKASIVILDPIYKLAPTGDENASQDAKKIVAMLDDLAEKSGATVVYCHHAAKGSPGDRIATDRGAGSGILARAFDGSLSIMPHKCESDAFVFEWTLRNYQCRIPEAVRWQNNHFELATDILPEPETGKTRHAKAMRSCVTTDTLVDRAIGMLADKPLLLATFKRQIQDRLGVGERRAGEIVAEIKGRPGICSAKEKRMSGAWYIGPEDAVKKLVAL